MRAAHPLRCDQDRHEPSTGCPRTRQHIDYCLVVEGTNLGIFDTGSNTKGHRVERHRREAGRSYFQPDWIRHSQCPSTRAAVNVAEDASNSFALYTNEKEPAWHGGRNLSGRATVQRTRSPIKSADSALRCDRHTHEPGPAVRWPLATSNTFLLSRYQFRGHDTDTATYGNRVAPVGHRWSKVGRPAPRAPNWRCSQFGKHYLDQADPDVIPSPAINWRLG
jgi:hypothetical protein